MKTYRMSLKIDTLSDGGRHTSLYDAEVGMDDAVTLGDIDRFTKDCKKIWSKAVAAARNRENVTDIYMELVASTYRDMAQTSFDRWYIRGIDDICTIKGEESVYMVPDTAYTPAHWDLLIQRDVMAGLANV